MKKKAQYRLLITVFEIIIAVTLAIIVGKMLLDVIGTRIHNKPYESYMTLLEKIEATGDEEQAPTMLILNKKSAIVGFPKNQDVAISKYKMRAATSINHLVFERKDFTGAKGCGDSKTCICLVEKAEWREENPTDFTHEYFKPAKFVCREINYDIAGDCVLEVDTTEKTETDECSTGFIISREISYKWIVGKSEQREIFIQKEGNLVGVCEQLPCIKEKAIA